MRRTSLKVSNPPLPTATAGSNSSNVTAVHVNLHLSRHTFCNIYIYIHIDINMQYYINLHMRVHLFIPQQTIITLVKSKGRAVGLLRTMKSTIMSIPKTIPRYLLHLR